MSTLGFFEGFLDDQIVIGSELKEEKMDLLSSSIQESGLFNDQTEDWRRSISVETDALLNSILTGTDADSAMQGSFDKPFSDTSSDSGCNFEQQLLSPEPQNSGLDLIEYISNHDEDEDDAPLLSAVNPRTNSPEPEVITTTFETGATTIILPVISPKTVKVTKTPAYKRRRVSASSNDSGVDDASLSPKQVGPNKKGKYPALELNEEERRLCEREGIKLPTHYPLSREEERNLKRIRRKIRNKVSAQDSRKRKKEYLDCMEDRVRACTEENSQLHKRIEQLETQNKTLAGQLKRLHQIIVNGGFSNRQNQTSTAMMVLLLSTALFLFPGFREHQESQKSEIDITQAIKMPPMPGQSRSLLHFAPTIKEEFNVASDNAAPVSAADNNNKAPIVHIKDASSPFHDHDYFMVAAADNVAKKRKLSPYIEADVPPQGYGFVEDGKDLNFITGGTEGDVYVVVEDESESQLNVNVTGSGSGTRTVVLHVPKDIK